MYKPHWQRLADPRLGTPADRRAYKQYLAGRKVASENRMESPSRWLSQDERDAFLHGYRDQWYEIGFLECDKKHAKEKGLTIVPNGKLPDGYYWIRPILTQAQKEYVCLGLDARSVLNRPEFNWRLGLVIANEVTFIGDKCAWTVKDGQLSFMSFTNMWSGETYVPHQFIQLQISPPEK